MQTEQTAGPSRVPVRRANAFPQSFAQQRLWFMQQMEPRSAYYNVAVALTLEGRLDRETRRQAEREAHSRGKSLPWVVKWATPQASVNQ